jgi:hypothetical protein
VLDVLCSNLNHWTCSEFDASAGGIRLNKGDYIWLQDGIKLNKGEIADMDKVE